MHGHHDHHQHPHVHPHTHTHDHPHHDQQRVHDVMRSAIDRRLLLRSGAFGLGAVLLAACGSNGSESAGDPSAATDSVADAPTSTATVDTSSADTVASEITAETVSTTSDVPAGFDAFAETVSAFTSGDVWMVESNGIPSHQMMVGITSWQQQVPVAQAYVGSNAWQFPQFPVLADEPISARTGLFRGAIALAVNGVPIFNALNNRGDDAFLVGELDEFGGHCGRADDYHYHAAPLHLQDIVGAARPIAYALDGFAIYGSVEPDGSPLEALDEYNGHIGSDGVYHYHGTSTYPYINGGLVGVVSVSDQVDPQPTTPAFRPAGEPLQGATITAFEDLGGESYRLEYRVDGAVGAVDYSVGDTTIEFTFTSLTGEVVTETYTR